MKDSFNYSGFSDMLFVSRRNKKSNSNPRIVIKPDQLKSIQDNPAKYYPPYLMLGSETKNQLKK